MSLTIEVNGEIYGDFSEASVSRSVEALSGSFRFDATARPNAAYPIRAGQPCRVRAGDQVVCVGYVESVQVGYDSQSHKISIAGRDRTCDLIDSTVGPNIEIAGPISLEAVIRTTLDRMGLTTIRVVNRVSDLEPFGAAEIVAAEVDKTGFEFLESFARQRQVFLTGDGAGNIVITRAGQTEAICALQNVCPGDPKNNVLTGSFSDQREDRFNRYEVVAQKSPSALGLLAEALGDTAESVATQSGVGLDDEIRAARRLHLQSEESGDSATAAKRAAWEANIRRARSRRYTATVQGFFQDAERTRLWVPNELVMVNDDFANVHARMLVWSVAYSYGLSDGSLTTLECAPPDALTPQPSTPKGQKKSDPVGIDWAALAGESEPVNYGGR